MSNYKGLVPGTFTMGNVVCGFIAILYSFEGDLTTASWFVFLAGFLDALDGKVARLSGGASRFGIELDSLADAISFGAAPAVVIYSLQLDLMGKLGWVVICIVYLMAALYRLARFNIMAETEEKRAFLGLPVPMAALTVTSFVIFTDHLWGELKYGQWLVVLIVVLALLMVSQIQYDTIPDKFDTAYNRAKLVALLAAGFAVLIQPRLLLFPILSSYILFGVARDFYRLFGKGVERVAARPDGTPRFRRGSQNDE